MQQDNSPLPGHDDTRDRARPNRRDYLKTVAATAALGGSILEAVPQSSAADAADSDADKAVRALYQALSDRQKKALCFDWDHKGPGGLPLRLHVTNNWAVSNTTIASLTKDQQALVEDILKSVLNPGWPEKLA